MNDANTTAVLVPDLGGATDVEVIELSVATGDRVDVDQTLLVLESDKASMEVPSSVAGTIAELKVKVGDKLSQGDVIALINATSDQPATAPAPAGTVQPQTAPPGAPAESVDESVGSEPKTIIEPESPVASAALTEKPSAESVTGPQPAEGRLYAGPAVRRLARDFGVELARVKGSGPVGRVLKEDVQAYVKSALQRAPSVTAGGSIPAVPVVDFSRFGPVREEKMSRLHQLTAANMHRSWLNVPHVTQFDDVDVTDLEQFRETLKDEAARRAVKLTPLPFLLKAAAAALRANPRVNGSLHPDGEQVVYKDYVHIGMAVDTPAGLVVPVLRDVDRKGIWQLAEETAALALKARDRKLSADDISGGCFTVSSLGNIGGRGFTPIINTPEVAILGVSRLSVQPVWDGEEFRPRKMLPVALSYDHRAVNGAEGGRFLADFSRLLSDIRQLVM